MYVLTYINIFIEDTSNMFNEKGGFYVAVHNNSKLPMVRYEGVRVPVGMETGKYLSIN
jgi:hypothetical protein